MSADTTPWRKSTRSGGNGGTCVEVRTHAGLVEVRDSEAGQSGPILRFSRRDWVRFLSDVPVPAMKEYTL